MKYMLLLYGPDRPFPRPGTSEFREMFEAWEAANEEMAKAGVLIDCAPLQPPSAATTVQVRDGQTLLTDGPAPSRPRPMDPWKSARSSRWWLPADAAGR